MTEVLSSISKIFLAFLSVLYGMIIGVTAGYWLKQFIKQVISLFNDDQTAAKIKISNLVITILVGVMLVLLFFFAVTHLNLDQKGLIGVIIGFIGVIILI